MGEDLANVVTASAQDGKDRIADQALERAMCRAAFGPGGRSSGSSSTGPGRNQRSSSFPVGSAEKNHLRYQDYIYSYVQNIIFMHNTEGFFDDPLFLYIEHAGAPPAKDAQIAINAGKPREKPRAAPEKLLLQSFTNDRLITIYKIEK